MLITGAVLPLLLLTLYLILLAFTIGRVADAIVAARSGSEYLARRLWRAVALLTFPFSLAVLVLGHLAVLVRIPMPWVTRLLSWGGWLLLTGLIAFSTYQLVNALAPSAVGRGVLVAYIVSLPLSFAAADLAARRLGQREADSRTWLRAVMAVTWVFGLATLGYLEFFHRRHLRRDGWMDALAVVGVAAVIVGAVYAAIAFNRSGGSPTGVSSAPPALATAPPPTASPSSVCQEVSSLRGLVVQRTDAFPQNHFAFNFPAEVTVTDAARVQAAARALCDLPAMAAGAISCPADFGIAYRLAFSAGGQQFPPVTVDATGCQTVHHLGTTARWTEPSPSFWVILGAALGLPHSDYATFRGIGPA